MQVWMTLVLAVQLLSAMTMIGLVLVQHGKGADMGASFGSGASGSLFGATGSANFLSRSTAVAATVFFLCTIALAYAGGGGRSAPGASVLDRPTTPSTAASAPALGSIPAGAPGAIPATPAAPAPAAQTPAAPGAGASGGTIPTH